MLCLDQLKYLNIYELTRDLEEYVHIFNYININNFTFPNSFNDM